MALHFWNFSQPHPLCGKPPRKSHLSEIWTIRRSGLLPSQIKLKFYQINDTVESLVSMVFNASIPYTMLLISWFCTWNNGPCCDGMFGPLAHTSRLVMYIWFHFGVPIFGGHGWLFIRICSCDQHPIIVSNLKTQTDFFGSGYSLYVFAVCF